jgi:hypothetical protein
MSKGLLSCGALALVLAACNGSPKPTEETRVTVATTIRPAIAWPASSSLDARALAAIGSPEIAKRSPVPVLAPSDLSLESPTLVVQSEFYSLAGWASGAKVVIQGTRKAHLYEDITVAEGDRDLKRARGFVTVNEGIRTASWRENGAAYTVDVECGTPDDARCASDDFVVSLVAHLAYVGGAGR